MTVAEMITIPGPRALAGPERHALIMPAGCECGMCTPTWTRRRGKSSRYSEPVTLLAALRRENAAARPGMIEQHRACLTAMLALISNLIAAEPDDDLGTPELGLPLVLFAGELAAAVQPDEVAGELPADLIHDCEQAITRATLAAAGCLTGLVEAVQTLSTLTR
jgi:hypothetical protein